MVAKIFILTDMHNFGFRAMNHILFVKQNWNILDSKHRILKAWT